MNTRLRATLYIVLVFLSGALAGALAMNVSEHRWIHSTLPWAKERPHVMEQVKKELNLTPDQAGRMDTILDDTMQQFQELHERSFHIRTDCEKRIRSILDDNQKRKFDTSLASLKKKYGIPD